MDETPEWITKAILSSANQKKRCHWIKLPVVEKAVEKAWGPVKELVESSLHAHEALLSLRILAVLTCPAPEKHPEVFKHCLVPMGEDMLEDAAKDRMKAVLPQELTGGF